MEKNKQDFLYLIACALNNEVADKQRVKAMNLTVITQFSKAHTLPALVCTALESAVEDKRSISELLDLKNKAIRKLMLLDAERKAIYTKLDELGIWYVPLKGILLKDLYPVYGTRQMADNDILFDKRYRVQVHDLFVSSGYEVESYHKANHDVYLKKPVYNFEMHVGLFADSYNTLKEYYDHFEDHYLWKDRQHSNERYMDVNDAYVFLAAHAYKHYSVSGTGIRTLTDIFVYNRAYDHLIDRVYVSKQCKSLGIDDFEQQLRSISNKLFSKPQSCLELPKEDENFLDYFMMSGTYGTHQHHIQNEVNRFKEKGSKHPRMSYVMNRLFPSCSWLKQNYPILNTIPVLLPFVVIYRLIAKLFSSRKKWKEELKYLKKM